MSGIELAVGAALNLALAAIALARRSLTPLGAVAGLAVGLGIYLSGGLLIWALLALFFVSSTLLSRFRHEDKRDTEGLTGKGARRDAAQVLANGGPALLMAIAWGLTGTTGLLVGSASALASANADTWASELGLLSRRLPVSLVGLRPVQRGASGGITTLGLAASLAGSALIAGAFAAGCGASGPPLDSLAPWGLAVAVSGFLGSVVDSLLGATLQARYRSPRTGEHTERRRGAAGEANTFAGGLRGVTNDAVNFLSGLLVSGAAALFATVLA